MEGAIRVLQDGLKQERLHSSAQADMMVRLRGTFLSISVIYYLNGDSQVLFELTWNLLGQRRHRDLVDLFLKLEDRQVERMGPYYFLIPLCWCILLFFPFPYCSGV